MRARSFWQDDAYLLYRRPILGECIAYTELLRKVYRDFGFADIIYKMATRPRSGLVPTRSGTSRGRTDRIVARSGVDFRSTRRGCILWPEDRVLSQDAIGRVWQCGTMQVLQHSAAARADMLPRTMCAKVR